MNRAAKRQVELGHFVFSTSNSKKTALKLVAVTDQRTGFTVRTALNNDGLQVPAIMAFAGARFSRSSLTAEDLFAEINTSAVSAQKKLANIFNNYGHASVGDMAMLFAYIEDVPRYLMMQFFYSTALGGGQERSSRYQNFAQSKAPNLGLFATEIDTKTKKTYYQLYQSLIDHYVKYLPEVTDAYAKLHKPAKGNKAHSSALQARVFDTVRAFLPAGASTSGAYITSAREWARLITLFKSSSHQDSKHLAQQLEILFNPPEEIIKDLNYTPEAPDLIRHTQPDNRAEQTLEQLRPVTSVLATYISGRGKKPSWHPQKVRHISGLLDPTEAYLFFSLTRLYPMLTIGKFTSWYKSLSSFTKHQLSRAIFSAYTHHKHIPLYGRTGGYTFEFKAALSEMIDFNRHRACGRFTPFLDTDDTLSLVRDGYTLPLYLDHPKLKKIRSTFESALDSHYEQLQKFGQDLPASVSPRILLALMPNAHYIRYYLTAGPKELSYLPQLRVRPGGHINYRDLAYQLAQQASAVDPLMSALALGQDKKPDPFSADEFFDRS